MGGGEDPRDSHPQEHGSSPAYGVAAAAEPDDPGAGFLGMIFGGSGQEPKCPDYVPDDLRLAFTQEADIAKGSLQARADEWQAEVAAARESRIPPDLTVKFVYAWTLSKCAGAAEQQQGCALLVQLLLEDGYEHADEVAYLLAHTNYLRGDLGSARHFCVSLLRMRPDSDRAQRLHALIRSAQSYKQEKSFEAAAVGGALLLGVAGLALAFAAGGKKR